MNEQSRDGVERSRAPACLPAALQASLSRSQKAAGGQPRRGGAGPERTGAPGAEVWRMGGVQGEADYPSGERVCGPCGVRCFICLQGKSYLIHLLNSRGEKKVCSTQGGVYKGKSNWDVFFSPVVIYGGESWTIKKAEHQRNDAFELWCWRRLESPLDCQESKPVNPKEIQS